MHLATYNQLNLQMNLRNAFFSQLYHDPALVVEAYNRLYLHADAAAMMGSWLTLSVLALFFALVTCSSKNSQVSLSKRQDIVVSCLLEFGHPPAGRCVHAVGGLAAVSLVHGSRKQTWVPPGGPAGEELRCGLTWSNGNAKTLQPRQRRPD